MAWLNPPTEEGLSPKRLLYQDKFDTFQSILALYTTFRQCHESYAFFAHSYWISTSLIPFVWPDFCRKLVSNQFTPNFFNRRPGNSVAKKCTWLLYNRDANFMHCKICTKIFKILRSFVFPGLQGHQMATLCLHAICPYGYRTHVHGSGNHTLGPRTRSLLAVWVQNSLQPFSGWMTVP